jgi:hypothetical protein
VIHVSGANWTMPNAGWMRRFAPARPRLVRCVSSEQPTVGLLSTLQVKWTCPRLVESHCLSLSFALKLFGAFVAKGRMPADGVIKAIDIWRWPLWPGGVIGSWSARSIRI